jgi:hypothetical protein
MYRDVFQMQGKPECMTVERFMYSVPLQKNNICF